MQILFVSIPIQYYIKVRKSQIFDCAQIHTETSYDGVYSHGSNRMPGFIDYVKKGWVDVDAEPTLENEFGAIKVYNGNMGPGILNALFAADRGMELADQYGIGMVGLRRNTTHWMRGGTYGLYAARKGYIAVMWTNTESSMPPWGGKDCRLGNNPFVMVVPGMEEEEPMVLDMAMSLYSYGKLQVTRLAKKKLPFPGGFDQEGNLTDDPGLIEQSRRMLPIGYWKGSSFAFMLDILGAILSDGAGAADIDRIGKGSCGGASQVMIIIDPRKIGDGDTMKETIKKAVIHLKSSELAEDSKERLPFAFPSHLC